MDKSQRFAKWDIDDSDLKNLTPFLVRDLLIECYFTAQKGMFRYLKEKSGVASDDNDIHQRIASLVRLAFVKVDEDFSNPSEEGLLKVMDYMAEMEMSWGTPSEITIYNATQVKKLIDRL